MGLFSFLKNAGAKVFGKSEKKEAAPEVEMAPIDHETVLRNQQMMLLKGVVNSLGLEVENLALDLRDDTVVVYGSVDTQSEKEKVVLALGNVAGIATVDDRLTVENPEPEAQFHTVQRGDSLSKISKKYYGDPMKYNAIFEANRPMLKNVDLIYPGQVLRIPAL